MKAAESIHLWQRIVEVYQRRLHESPEAAGCLRALGLANSPALEHFQAGYSDGTLARMLPKGGTLRNAMVGSGLVSSGGEDTLNGCLVVPVLGVDGGINGFCGVRPGNNGAPDQVLVPASASGFVRGALARDGSPLFISRDILEVFALWHAGFTNVIGLPGQVSTTELEWLVREIGCHQVYAGQDVAGMLNQTPDVPPAIAVRMIPWPQGISTAVEFFKSHTPDEFRALLPSPAQSQQPLTEPGDESVKETPEGMEVCFQKRRYELRAIQKPGLGRLRATVRVMGSSGRFVVETVDFYQVRSRRGFLSEASRMFHEPLDVLESDLNRLTDLLEHYLQKRAAESGPKAGVVTESDRMEGMKLGRAPDLAGEIVRDMGRLGMIGEEGNKLLAYLVMTSRKLPDPLALLILSASGAGKSHLQDTVLALCPEEDLIKLTSLTDQALFYRGEDSLRHKVLALEELTGARGADYAIRNLISARKLVIETTMRNPLTGKLETQVNTVHGPTAVFQTTTNPHTDAETRSRFIVVSVDESPAQTRAILERQRQAHTLESWRYRQERERILRRHQAFQRLLRPLPVINPFEPLLSYPDQNLVVRRDHPKYLQLILAITFLHQMQRPLRHDSGLGDYLEATLDDIALANELAHQAFGNSLTDLSQPSRDLLGMIETFMENKAASDTADKVTFSRRELREAIHWSDSRLRIHLRELVELEYASPLSGRFGVTYHYRLLPHTGQDSGRFLAGLKSVEQLRQESHLIGIATSLAPTSQAGKCEVFSESKPSGAGTCATRASASHPSLGEPVPHSPNQRADL